MILPRVPAQQHDGNLGLGRRNAKLPHGDKLPRVGTHETRRIGPRNSLDERLESLLQKIVLRAVADKDLCAGSFKRRNGVLRRGAALEDDEAGQVLGEGRVPRGAPGVEEGLAGLVRGPAGDVGERRRGLGVGAPVEGDEAGRGGEELEGGEEGGRGGGEGGLEGEGGNFNDFGHVFIYILW